MLRYTLIFLVFIIIGCGQSSNKDDGKLYVVSTTGMLHDAVINIGGDKIKAHPIMGPGVDPHLYKATQGDLRKLREADIVIYNGLSLEGKMEDILDKLGKNKPTIAAAEKVPKENLITAVDYQNSYDPHVWFDVSLWQYCVKAISEALIKNDPENADTYRQNTEQYLNELEELHAFVRKEINQIPEGKRILVTAHDAFGYFGKAYDIRVVGLQGISTIADVSLRNVTDIIDLIIENEIKAVFVETSVSNRTVQAVVDGCREKGHKVEIGGSLYSDAMGEYGTYEGTYVGMVKSNVEAMVKGLNP